jgi:hypothetical protein
MSVECFREAVYASKDWPGVVAAFGGNPCVHPDFSELCRIMSEEIPQQSRRGLWASSFGKYGELVRRTFYPTGRMNLNAHGNREVSDAMERWTPGKVILGSADGPSWHTPILVDWRDVGLDEERWVAYREKCPINRKWSSAIVEGFDGRPRAYFCEVAAAIDDLLGGDNGIPAEPGWWKNGMDAFQHQVDACCDAGCGVPFCMRGHLDRDGVYDVSASWKLLVPDDVVCNLITGLSPKVKESTDYMRLRS